MSASQKREKMKERKSLLTALEVTSASDREACNSGMVWGCNRAACLRVFTSVSRKQQLVISQNTDLQYLEHKNCIAQPGSHGCEKAASPIVRCCSGAVGGRWELLPGWELKLTRITWNYCTSLTLEVINRFQSSKIVIPDRTCLCNCCLDGKTDFWYFLLCHLSRILPCNWFLSIIWDRKSFSNLW